MGLNVDQNNLAFLLPELPRTQLEEIVLQQLALIENLQTQISKLEKEVQYLKNKPPTSTAPFGCAPEKLKKNPKPRGQKEGHEGFFRQPPKVTETIDVPLEYCPDCLVEVEHLKYHTQIIEELPLIIPQVIQITTQSGICPKCRKKVRSTHPWQSSKAMGAAGVSLGPRVKAVAIELQHRFHLTKSKSCAILKEFFGINLSRGGLVHISHRAAARLQPKYHQLEREVQQSSHIHADERGWYVNRRGHQLCVFTNQAVTLYKIAERRTRELIKKVLGEHYQGVLITDCLAIYDEVNGLQQKCYAHHLRAIEEGLKKMPEGKSLYLEEIKLMLQTAMSLKTVERDLSRVQFRERIKDLERWAEKLLKVENLSQQLEPEEARVRQRLSKQADHLFEFLRHKAVEATNNQAERQLRPAVIARKLSCGNRSEKGARTWEVLASLAVTSKQRNESFKDLVKDSMFGFSP